jgi:hypothetical protein
VPGSPLQNELSAELGEAHPLKAMEPRVFGRCLVCDDVVASLATVPEVAVVHLTWQGRDEARRSGAVGHWPYFERMTTTEFTQRFLRGGEHL